MNGIHAASGLPVVLIRPVNARPLELAQRAQRIEGANPVLGLPSLEHPARNRPHLGAKLLHVRCADHRHRHAGESLGEHDVAGMRFHDGVLVGVIGIAFGCGNEARAQLHTGIPHVDERLELLGRTHAAGGDHGQSEPAHLIEERAWVTRAGVPTRLAVHRHQSVHATITPLLCPLQLGNVVVHHATHGMHAVAHPLRIPQ